MSIGVLKKTFIFLILVCGYISIQGALKFQSPNSEIDFSDSNASLKLQSTVRLIDGNITLRDFGSTSYTTTSTMNMFFFNNGALLAKTPFNPAADTLDPASSLQRLVLKSNQTINYSSTSWAFNANTEIDGDGATLVVNKNQGITITGTSQTLTLKNMKLVTHKYNAIACLTDTCRLKLENVEWQIGDSGFVFGTGHLDIDQTVKLSGILETNTTFEFNSKGLVSIFEYSELIISNNLNFKMNANPVSDANFNATKRHLIINNTSAFLTLSGGSFETTNTGVALDRGGLKFVGTNTIKTTSNSYAKFETSALVSIQIDTAKLILDGIWQHAEGTMLRYGDSTSFKHSNYGFYMQYPSGGFNDGGHIYGVTTLDNTNTKWYIQPGEEPSRFGSKIGQPVRSGDFVKIEIKSVDTGAWGNQIFFLCVYFNPYLGALRTPSSGSTPQYIRMSFSRGYFADNVVEGTNNYNYVPQLFRIYKVGATIGDPILLNDSIYLVTYPIYDTYWTTSPFNVNKKYYYVGSSNVDYSVGYKEVFGYQVTNNSQPGNLASQLTWLITDVQANDYLNASSFTQFFTPTDINLTGTIAQWPSASLTQF